MRFSKLGILFVLCGIVGAEPAFAVTLLKQVQFHKGDEAKLVFDELVTKDQVAVEYINDIVQVSIKNVAVYPAKMMSTSGEYLTKIFAYQYSPKLIRCRFSLKGKALDFKDHLRIIYSGQSILVRFDKSDLKQQKTIEALNEKALLEKVTQGDMSNTQSAEIKPESKKEKTLASTKLALSESAPAPSPSPKPMASIWAAFARLGAGLLVFGLILLGLRWIRTSSLSAKFLSKFFKDTKFSTFLDRFAQGAAGKTRASIEVVSKCHLDPKRSLVVARVGGRQFFLGVTQDSIRLISELSEGASPESILGEPRESRVRSALKDFDKDLNGSFDFSDVLDSDPTGNRSTPSTSVRSRIKNRLEGLKPL